MRLKNSDFSIEAKQNKTMFFIKKPTNYKWAAKLIGKNCGKSEFKNEEEFLSCPYSIQYF
jgi:hypothetical protein